jgi:cytochrome c peroxidase
MQNSTIHQRTPIRQAGFCCLVAILLALCAPLVNGDESLTAPDRTDPPNPFSRQALLAKFNKNADGELNAAERSDVRASFGDLDVPLLPTEPDDYCELKLPPHFQKAKVLDLDNTPHDNVLTNGGATLGRVLFYDKQLSRNNTIACASCHLQKSAFADPRQFSPGFAGGHTKRNAMGLVNLRFTCFDDCTAGLFWDERAESLEQQALMPVQDQLEMGMDLSELERKLSELPYYAPLFQQAFGSPEVTSSRIARAIAQFVRSIVSCNSRFDEAAATAADVTQDFEGWTAEENLGKELFFEGADGFTEFACAMCHQPPTFNMSMAMNIGLDMEYVDTGLGALNRKSNDRFTPSNDGKFKAPSLRNVAITAPYMHDGRFKTLDEVLKHYSEGVHPHPNLELAFRQPESDSPTNDLGMGIGFGFSDRQKAALIAFLKTLTDEKLINDPRYSDPFLRAEP